MSSLSFLRPRPGVAWCWVWLPTLMYFVYTRLPGIGYYHRGNDDALANHVHVWDAASCAALARILYTAAPCPTDKAAAGTHLPLEQALQLLWNAGESTSSSSSSNSETKKPQILLTHSVWYHDQEAGRGALLVTQASGTGRLWRWETGGGPIPIGRTLVLDAAGCRSAACLIDKDEHPLRGVGAVAVQTKRDEKSSSSSALLVLAEWGEGRIIRLEQETGARTPLVMHVPCSFPVCGNDNDDNNSTAWQRIRAPRDMHVTNQGDLIFLDSWSLAATNDDDDDSSSSSSFCMILWKRAAVHRIPPLASLASSRQAHAWTSLPQDDDELLWTPMFVAPPQQPVGGFVVVEDKVLASAYKVVVSTTLPRAGVVLLEINVDNDEEDENEKSDANAQSEPRILFRLSRYLPTALEPGPLVMSSNKQTIYLATPEGVAILVPNSGKNNEDAYRLAGLLHVPIMDRPRITSLTLGDDSYLYVTTESRLWRIKVKD